MNEAALERAFRTPFFRALDERALRDLTLASRVRDLPAGAEVYAAGQAADDLYVVVAGEVALRAVRRGDEEESTLRVARQGDLFGEESTVTGASRMTRAVARVEGSVVEVPYAILSRVRQRGGVGEDALAREQRALSRALSRDVLASSALGHDLPEGEVALLLDSAEFRPVARGQALFRAGSAADHAFILVAGLVQIQTQAQGRTRVMAYLSRGDAMGDAAALAGDAHDTTAVAMSDAHVLALPRSALRSVVDRNPGVLARLRRVTEARDAAQAPLLVESNATSHVLADVYRMHAARALLVIDQDSCVRCGQCSLACGDVHGATRLVRRGDKIVTALAQTAMPSSLLVPNSCQHCENPSCMIDCPTGAIGRESGGEVFIRAELCTGCAACAKACPWDNIRMAPRNPSAPSAAVNATSAADAAGTVGHSALVATKCDLCRERAGPACVQACPTGSLLRVDPSRDFADVFALFPGRVRAPSAAASGVAQSAWVTALPLALAMALLGLGAGLHARGTLSAGSGVGLVAGPLALGAVLALFGYAVQKRAYRKNAARVEQGARAVWQRVVAPSSTRRAYQWHIWLGLGAMAAVAWHAGIAPARSTHTLVGPAFWCASVLGALGALAYRVLPAALTRVERKGLLPEDFRRERERLKDRLFRAASGKSDVVKLLLQRVLLPYARAPWGALALLLSGHTLRQEEARVQRKLDAILGDKAKHHAAALAELTRVVVELRALPARRFATAALRAVLPLHVLSLAVFLLMLAVHLIAIGRQP
ncbi:MAG: cyclic nucleotide-binding domain-containing protein [Polyangiaceae bacterium]